MQQALNRVRDDIFALQLKAWMLQVIINGVIGWGENPSSRYTAQEQKALGRQ